MLSEYQMACKEENPTYRISTDSYNMAYLMKTRMRDFYYFVPIIQPQRRSLQIILRLLRP